MNLEAPTDFVLVAVHGGVTQAARASNRLPSAKVKAFLRFLDGAFPDGRL